MRSLINRYYSWYYNLNSLKQFAISLLIFWVITFSFDMIGEIYFYHEGKSFFRIGFSALFSAFFMAVITGSLFPDEWKKQMWEKKQKERQEKLSK